MKPHAGRWVFRFFIAGLLGSGLRLAATEEFIFETQDYPPYTFLEGGEVAGAGAEVVRAVCREMGQPCRINLVPWARAQLDVREGKAQALFLIGLSLKRTEWIVPSVALMRAEYGIFVNTKNPLRYTDLMQLKDFQVGVYGPSNSSVVLESIKQRVPGLTVDMTPTDDAAFKKLDANRIQAVFSNRDTGFAKLKRLGLTHVRYAGKHSGLTYHVGFSRTQVPPAQVEAFNQAYRKLLRSGEIQRILKAAQLGSAAPE